MPVKRKEFFIDNKKIEVFDDVFSASEKFNFYEFANNSLYAVDRFGASAPEHTKFHKTLKSTFNLTDMLNFDFFKNDFVLDYIEKNNLRVRECYINLCTASDIYAYHTDTYTDGIITGLYYMNLEWHPTWEGETHFSDENMNEVMYSASFLPGRLIFFDGNIPHKSSQPGPLAEFYRYVFTIKFSKANDLKKNYTNAVKIEDFIYKKDCTISDKEKDVLNYLKIKLGNTMHTQNCTLFEHLSNTFYILKHFNQSEEVCLAGLFHSVYGTEFFNAGLNIEESEIVDIIGSYANDLVKCFSIQNRDQAIIENVFNVDVKTNLDLLYILYANLIEQAYRQSVNRQLIYAIRNRIDLISI
jgi:hypothetical protein